MWIHENSSLAELKRAVEAEPDLAEWLVFKGINVETVERVILHDMMIEWIMAGDEACTTTEINIS